jgi:hypothetical protein
VIRLAARASVQESHTDKTMTPRQLFDWAQTNIKNMNFEFVTKLEFMEEGNLLFKINSAAKPMHGTVKLRSFVPLRKGKLIVKTFPPEQSLKNAV